MSSLMAAKHENHEQVYETDDVVYRKASLVDDDILKSILRENTMESWVTLSAEHEPSYFDATGLFGKTETILAYKSGDEKSTVGMCSSVTMPVHINGSPVNAGYLSELRVTAEFRNKLGIVRNGFKSVQVLNESQQALSYWFTSLAKENYLARRLLEANLKGMPVYRPKGELVTVALPTSSGKQSDCLQPAQLQDIPAIVEFYNKQACHYQYAPVLSEAWLRELNGRNGLRLQDFWLLKENHTIKACFALWDQRKIKQSIVRGYKFPLNLLRRPYNIYANLFGRVALPMIGEQIDYIFIAFLAMDEPAKEKVKTIINSALFLIKQRNAKIGMLGLSVDNPALQYLETFPMQTYSTCIESVTWPGSTEQNLEPLPVQPEIAIL